MRIKEILSRIKKIRQYLKSNEDISPEPSRLIEYDLLDFNEDLDEAWVKIKALYDEVLYKDKYWHLFYEGDFSTLRCSPQYIDVVEDFLDKHNINYKCNGAWIDGSHVVEKYKKIYRNMFHTFSELAIHLDEKDINVAADRVCHSFFNHIFYMAKEYREHFNRDGGQHPSSMMWEADIMANLLIYRAYYIGKYDTTKYIQRNYECKLKEKSEKVRNN